MVTAHGGRGAHLVDPEQARLVVDQAPHNAVDAIHTLSLIMAVGPIVAIILAQAHGSRSALHTSRIAAQVTSADRAAELVGQQALHDDHRRLEPAAIPPIRWLTFRQIAVSHCAITFRTTYPFTRPSSIAAHIASACRSCCATLRHELLTGSRRSGQQSIVNKPTTLDTLRGVLTALPRGRRDRTGASACRGILIGGLYVAISIGFSLSFGVLDVVDLAVGMWVVLGAFAAIVASDALGVDAFALLPVVFIAFGVVGWLIAPLIYRVRTSKYALPALMGLAFTFGLATLIRGGLLTVFGYTPRTVHTDLVSGNVELLGITAPTIRVAGFGFAVRHRSVPGVPVLHPHGSRDPGHRTEQGERRANGRRREADQQPGVRHLHRPHRGGRARCSAPSTR